MNPDPKSLWKVIDPPSDAPFYKKSIDHQSVCRSGIHIAGASRRGRSHEHVGSFRDDDYYLNFSDVSGWSVLLVADGAGSAKYSRKAPVSFLKLLVTISSTSSRLKKVLRSKTGSFAGTVRISEQYGSL